VLRTRPSIWLYGGVHDDPGSRHRFVAALAEREAPPHFVAVEWEAAVFDRLVSWRRWIEKELGSRWSFLDREDCRELSQVLGWEGDAYRERFPTAMPLWLETGFQETDLGSRSEGRPDELLQRLASGLLHRLMNPSARTMHEFWAGVGPPVDPTSKSELIDRVSKAMWADVSPPTSNDLEREIRWAAAISERTADLGDGWVAVVVGGAHVAPGGDANKRLRGLLSSSGHRVIPVSLEPLSPPGTTAPRE
jgi:hypothetical protein